MFRIERDNVDYNKGRAFYVNVMGSAEDKQGSVPKPEAQKEDLAKKKREIMRLEQKITAELDKARADSAREANEIIQNAHSESENIIAQSRAQVDEIHEQARREGYEDGRRTAENEAREASIAQEERVAALMDDMEKRTREYIDSLESQFIDLTLDIAKKIVHIELDKDDQLFVGIVQNAVAQIQREGKLVARVSSEDYKRCFPEGTARFLIDNETVMVSITEEPLMSPADCVIESEGETINAGVQMQFNHIEKALKDIRD